MNKQIYLNLPVRDLAKATAFYAALGFTQNSMFSDENASAMQWSEDIVVMLLSHEFYKKFPRNREIADAHKTSAALLSVTLDSKEAVQQFAETAKANGGDFYKVDTGVPADMMFGYEVEDLDGHIWEPVWMNPNFNPQG